MKHQDSHMACLHFLANLDQALTIFSECDDAFGGYVTIEDSQSMKISWETRPFPLAVTIVRKRTRLDLTNMRSLRDTADVAWREAAIACLTRASASTDKENLSLSLVALEIDGPIPTVASIRERVPGQRRADTRPLRAREVLYLLLLLRVNSRLNCGARLEECLLEIGVSLRTYRRARKALDVRTPLSLPAQVIRVWCQLVATNGMRAKHLMPSDQRLTG